MLHNDPFESWLFHRKMKWLPSHPLTEQQAKVSAALDRLTAFLDNPPPKRALSDLGLWGWNGAVSLNPTDVPRAQELYRRVFLTGGTGSKHVQETLLDLLAATEDPTSVPFWKEMLDLSRPRDHFTGKRRTFALAALAQLLAQRDAPSAYEALQQAAHHSQPEVRALAVRYLGLAYLETERPIPLELRHDLIQIATHDKAFEPRFQARMVLRNAEQPVPQEHPHGAYDFKVKFMRDKGIFRTIAVRAKQTLDDLHFAILRAINWDADHLYSFFMNGQLYDARYQISCPQDEDAAIWTDEIEIGNLGLVMKHKFLYYFDYGDSHKFEVEVVGIHPDIQQGKYPRLVESKGKAPAQYGWEDEDNDEWEDK